MELSCSFLRLQDSAAESEERSAQLNIITLIFHLILTPISLIGSHFPPKGMSAHAGNIFRFFSMLYILMMTTILNPNEAHGLSCHFSCINKD
jgi:hypothetical protein